MPQPTLPFLLDNLVVAEGCETLCLQVPPAVSPHAACGLGSVAFAPGQWQSVNQALAVNLKCQPQLKKHRAAKSPV
jgi:hypothetical protein